jgi:hypothetical protein
MRHHLQRYARGIAPASTYSHIGGRGTVVSRLSFYIGLISHTFFNRFFTIHIKNIRGPWCHHVGGVRHA